MRVILKTAILRFFVCQLAIGATLVIAMSLLYGINASQSTLFGITAVIIPNIVLALFLFMHTGKRSARQVINDCYLGELLKLITMIIIVIIILRYFTVQFFPFWMGFLGVYSVYWFAPKLMPRQL